METRKSRCKRDEKTRYAQVLKNTPIKGAKATEIQRVVRIEIIESN